MPPKQMVTGNVTIHARTMLPAIPHFTADALFAVPAPIIEVVMTCVVLTGAPKNVISSIDNAEAVCAAKPDAGCNFVTPLPMVFMIFQPPIEVPSAITVAQEIFTHSGTPLVLSRTPPVIRANVIMPIVFWASLFPCEYATSAAEKSCSFKNILLTLFCDQLANILNIKFKKI